MRRNGISRSLLTLATVVLIVSSCAPSRQTDRRSAYAKRKSGPVKIALVWPFALYRDLIAEGVRLSVDEVNARGGVLKRPLELITEDDNAEVEKGLLLAETYTEDPQIMAVIGHRDSSVSLSVALTYEINNLIMFSPASTSAELTEKGYAYIFRNVPTDDLIGRKAAELCRQKELSSVAIVYSGDSYGLGMANAFERRINELRLKVTDRRSFNEGTPAEMDYILDRLEIYAMDGFFFAGPIDAGMIFLEKARERGYSQPVIGGEGLDSLHLLEMEPWITKNVFIMTAYNPYSGRQASLDFNAAFLKKFGHVPDSWAALGYDAVKVLVEAMERARSPDPVAVAPRLHALNNYAGVTGVHTFDEKGDVRDKTIVIKFIENRAFKYIDFKSGETE